MQDRWTNSDGSIDLRCGDCRDVMATLGADSVDAIVTDPPYGLSFMGKGWDRGVPGSEFWTAALRVAKPGAHLLAFGGTRTHHRLMCAIEDAGWEIRDVVMWVYGSGFPKSLDVSKAIDLEALVAAGLVRRTKDGLRLLGSGEITAKVALTVDHVTGTARAAVEKAGGSITVIEKKILAADVAKSKKSQAKKNALNTKKPAGAGAE